MKSEREPGSTSVWATQLKTLLWPQLRTRPAGTAFPRSCQLRALWILPRPGHKAHHHQMVGTAKGRQSLGHHREDMGVMCLQRVAAVSLVIYLAFHRCTRHCLGSIPTHKKGWNLQITLEKHRDVFILIICFLLPQLVFWKAGAKNTIYKMDCILYSSLELEA